MRSRFTAMIVALVLAVPTAASADDSGPAPTNLTIMGQPALTGSALSKTVDSYFSISLDPGDLTVRVDLVDGTDKVVAFVGFAHPGAVRTLIVRAPHTPGTFHLRYLWAFEGESGRLDSRPIIVEKVNYPEPISAKYRGRVVDEGGVVRRPDPCVVVDVVPVLSSIKKRDRAKALKDLRFAVTKLRKHLGYSWRVTTTPKAGHTKITVKWTSKVRAHNPKALGTATQLRQEQRGSGQFRVGAGRIWIAPKMARHHNAKYRRSLMMHELAHIAGLGHSKSKRDLMYPGLSPTSARYLSSADRYGLRRLGIQAGCLS